MLSLSEDAVHLCFRLNVHFCLCSVTPGGHRVTVFWDAHRLVKGEDWEEGFATGLLNSLCIFPLLSYGATAPLAAIDPASAAARGWDERPFGRARLAGVAGDPEDNVLKELLIAGALLERKNAEDRDEEEKGILQVAYPILVGRVHPPGHPEYPHMGSFFAVQGGGGEFPQLPSPATNSAVARFLHERAGVPDAAINAITERTVAAAIRGMTALQGCQLWNHPADLAEVALSKEQRDLVGRGFAGPSADLEGERLLSPEQKTRCCGGFDERQLRMIKAQLMHKLPDFHNVIDRAVAAKLECGRRSCINVGQGRRSSCLSASYCVNSVCETAKNGDHCSPCYQLQGSNWSCSTVSGDSKDQSCKSTDGESIAATSIFLEDMHSFRLPALPYKTLL